MTSVNLPFAAAAPKQRRTSTAEPASSFPRLPGHRRRWTCLLRLPRWLSGPPFTDTSASMIADLPCMRGRPSTCSCTSRKIFRTSMTGHKCPGSAWRIPCAATYSLRSLPPRSRTRGRRFRSTRRSRPARTIPPMEIGTRHSRPRGRRAQGHMCSYEWPCSNRSPRMRLEMGSPSSCQLVSGLVPSGSPALCSASPWAHWPRRPASAPGRFPALSGGTFARSPTRSTPSTRPSLRSSVLDSEWSWADERGGCKRTHYACPCSAVVGGLQRPSRAGPRAHDGQRGRVV